MKTVILARLISNLIFYKNMAQATHQWMRRASVTHTTFYDNFFVFY